MDQNQGKEIAISNVDKFITIMEMESLILVLKKRQEYFADIMEKRKEFAQKTIGKLKEAAEQGGEEIVDKLELLTNEFAKNMDKKFLEDHKEELNAQQGVIEFLKRFTGEDFVDYNEEFKKTMNLE